MTLQRHRAYADPFARSRRRPRSEERDRFGGALPDISHWGTSRTLDEMTPEETHGAMALAAVRTIGWLTGLGATVALVIATIRLWTGE